MATQLLTSPQTRLGRTTSKSSSPNDSLREHFPTSDAFLSNSLAGDAMTAEDFALNEEPEQTPIARTRGVLLALQALKQAHDSAFEFHTNVWEFSIELEQMLGFGVATHVLRAMVCQGWIQHQRETSKTNASNRTFEAATGLNFCERSCFAITKEGYLFIQSQAGLESLDTSAVKNRGNKMSNSGSAASGSIRRAQPVWDRDKREFRLGDVLVKKFKWPAKNQEALLSAFEDAGWPMHLKNPLPPSGISMKQQLHDTIKCLNQGQVNECVKFRGDGTALGVRLEINPDATATD